MQIHEFLAALLCERNKNCGSFYSKNAFFEAFQRQFYIESGGNAD